MLTFSPESDIRVSELALISPSYCTWEIAAFLKDFVATIKEAGAKLAKSDNFKQMQALSDDQAALEAIYEKMDGIMEEGSENSNHSDNTVLYSIQRDSLGQYVEVETDQELFDGLDARQTLVKARDYILQHYRNKYIGEGSARSHVTHDTADKYANAAKRRGVSDDLKIVKGRVSTELEDLLTVSTFLEHHEDDGRHPEAVNSWDHYKTRFSIAGKFFDGKINILKGNGYQRLYDLTDIKEVSLATRGLSDKNPNAPAQGDLNKSIPNSAENVNKKYSIRDTDTDQTQTAAFKEGKYAEYNVNIDVKEKQNGMYVYSVGAEKIKGSERSTAPNLYGDPKAILASGNGITPAIATNSISDSAQKDNIKLSQKEDQAGDIRYSLKETDENVQSQLSSLQEALELTAGHRLSAVEADRLAGKIAHEFASGMDRAELATELARVFETDGVSMAQLDDELNGVADKILQKSETLDTTHEEEAKPVRDKLRSSSISLTDSQWAEAESLTGSRGAYRKSIWGRARLTNDGTPLDVMWPELTALNPELFPADTAEGDMPLPADGGCGRSRACVPKRLWAG